MNVLAKDIRKYYKNLNKRKILFFSKVLKAMEKHAKIFMLTFGLNMDYYLVNRDNKEENTIQKINISCGSVNLIMAIDSNEIINFFLHNRETVRKTILG